MNHIRASREDIKQYCLGLLEYEPLTVRQLAEKIFNHSNLQDLPSERKAQEPESMHSVRSGK